MASLPLPLRCAVKFCRSAGFYHQARNFYRMCKYELVSRKLMPFRLPYMVLSVGQACNYKCKNCGNFAPFAPAEFMRYKFEDVAQWMSKILDVVDSINTLQIQGGEPFLYSDLGRLITYLRNIHGGGGGINSIEIATNGSILPNDDLLKILKDSNVDVRISNYNITPEKTKILQETLQNWGIRHTVYFFTSHNGYWYDKGSINAQDYPHYDDKVLNRRFDRCNNSGCLTLERGRLAHCSRANNAPVIQGFEAPSDDYILLSDYADRDELKKALMKYCLHPKFMEACRYCYGSEGAKMIPPAVQLEER